MRMRRVVAVLGCFLGLTVLSSWSLNIVVTDPNPVYFTQAQNCGVFPNCYDAAFLRTVPINATTPGLTNAFSNWNTNYGGGQWSIVNGGFLDATFNVDIFRAQITDGKTRGGVEIDIQFDYKGTGDKLSFFWAQGILTNRPNDTTGAYMDVKVPVNPPPNCFDRAPLYPCQYDDRSFYDFPERDFEAQTVYWYGFAYPVQIDNANHTLKVYQGINYGFQLSTPEPGTFLMLGTGCLWTFVRIRVRLRMVRKDN